MNKITAENLKTKKLYTITKLLNSYIYTCNEDELNEIVKLLNEPHYTQKPLNQWTLNELAGKGNLDKKRIDELWIDLKNKDNWNTTKTAKDIFEDYYRISKENLKKIINKKEGDKKEGDKIVEFEKSTTHFYTTSHMIYPQLNNKIYRSQLSDLFLGIKLSEKHTTSVNISVEIGGGSYKCNLTVNSKEVTPIIDSKTVLPLKSINFHEVFLKVVEPVEVIFVFVSLDSDTKWAMEGYNNIIYDGNKENVLYIENGMAGYLNCKVSNERYEEKLKLYEGTMLYLQDITT